MAELAGVMVGNYFLLECLRSEGMVETYLARPTTSGGYDVYLRLFRPRFPDPLAFQDHFATEVRKVWRCRHPHIQPLTEFGEGDGLLYTTVRAGGALTLEQVLEKQGSKRLPLRLVVQLMTQLCEALQYAHERDIVHGNLQPSSILLDLTKQTLVTNFGLRQAYQEGDPTVAQVEEGNAAYIAPEQVVGMLCPASDIYALGVLLYRLLGGTLPYEGESAGEMALLHANEPIPSLRTLRPDLPEAIDMVVRMALAKSPAARFQTPQALAEALESALTRNSSPSVAAPSTTRRIAVNPRRTRLTWSRALSLMALTLILLGLSSTLYLFPFTRLVLNTAGSPLRSLGQPGSFSIFFPGLHPTTASSSSASGAGAQSQTAQSHSTPTPGRQGVPTPVATSSPGIQQSPIVFPATPTVAPPTANPPQRLICTPGTLKIDGSFYLAPLLQQVGIDYRTFCMSWQLGLEQKGCQAGITELRHGQIDLAASDLSIQPAGGLTDYPIAALLYAVVVSPDVQISGLSSQQLQAIYQGRTTNWLQVGGPDKAISVLLHPSTDPLNALFQRFVLNDSPVRVQGIKLSRKLTPEQIAQKVAGTPGAISFVPLAVAGTAPVHILALNRVMPAQQNVLQGIYPFWSVEHLYAPATLSAQAQVYMQFFQAAAETNRLAQAGALPLSSLPPAVLSSHMPGPIIDV